MEFEPSNGEFSRVRLSLVLCVGQFCLRRRSWHRLCFTVVETVLFQKGTYLPQTYIIQEEMIATEHVSDMEQLGSFIYRLCSGKETYRLKRRSARRRKSLAVFSLVFPPHHSYYFCCHSSADLFVVVFTGDLLGCFPSNSSQPKSGRLLLLLQTGAGCCVPVVYQPNRNIKKTVAGASSSFTCELLRLN